MRRREFIPLLGGAAAWPLAARAQEGGPKRRLGAIIGFAEDDPEVRFFVEAFDQGLRELGWFDGRNIRIETWPPLRTLPERCRSSSSRPRIRAPSRGPRLHPA